MTTTEVTSPPPLVDLVKRPAAPPPAEAAEQGRPTRHRLGDPRKVHVVLYAGYHARPRGLARLFAGGAR